MDFKDRITTLSSQTLRQIEHIETEEATKNALVMPFLNALGYNVFDPTEVVPEYTADLGTKKGEKVDYAILRDGKPIVLVECKHCGSSLPPADMSQLFRYFTVTEARVGILTNGVLYKFFSDLDAPNKMDTRPFLEVDLSSLDEHLIPELRKLSKDHFNLEQIVNAATELKYTNEIKKILRKEMENPSEEFVRLCISDIYSGRLTQSVKDQFKTLVGKAFRQFIKERITERFQSAIDNVSDNSEPSNPKEVDEIESTDSGESRESRINTTEEEIEGYHIVKALLRSTVDPKRIHGRDTISYFGVLLDNNNRKPICRLHLNSPNKRYIGIFDSDKKETKIAIEDLNDIFKLADQIRATISFYEN